MTEGQEISERLSASLVDAPPLPMEGEFIPGEQATPKPEEPKPADPKPAEEPPKPETPPVADPPKSFREYLPEKHRERFKSDEDLDTLIDEYEKLKNSKVDLHEKAKKFNDYLQSGGKVDPKFIRILGTNYDEIKDAYQIIEEKLALDGLSKDEIEYKLRTEFKKGSSLNPDDFETDDEKLEVRAFKSKLEREANTAREGLKKMQADLDFSADGSEIIKKKEQEQKEKNQKLQDHYNEIKKKTSKVIEDTATGLKQLPFAIKDKESGLGMEVKFDLTESDIKEGAAFVTQLATDTASAVYSRYKADDGSLDANRMLRDEHILKNFEKILHKTAITAYALGGKKQIMDIKAITDVPREDHASTLSLAQSQEAAVLSSMKKSG